MCAHDLFVWYLVIHFILTDVPVLKRLALPTDAHVTSMDCAVLNCAIVEMMELIARISMMMKLNLIVIQTQTMMTTKSMILEMITVVMKHKGICILNCLYGLALTTLPVKLDFWIYLCCWIVIF